MDIKKNSKDGLCNDPGLSGVLMEDRKVVYRVVDGLLILERVYKAEGSLKDSSRAIVSRLEMNLEVK